MHPRVEVIIDPNGFHRCLPGRPNPPETFAGGVEVYSMAELLLPTIAYGNALSEDGKLLEDTVRWMCSLPEQAHVYELRRQSTLFEVEVAPSDAPRILGRDCRHFYTLRQLFEKRSLPRTLVELVNGPLLSLTPRADARPLLPRTDAELEHLVTRLVQRFVGPPEVATVKLASSEATALIEVWRTTYARRVPRDIEYTCTSIHMLVMRMQHSLGKRIILNIC